MIIRIVDIILALLGIVICMPFLPLIALLMRMDSKGPMIYRAERVGKDMITFKMYKFRTMFDTKHMGNQSVCPQYDPRVTPFGRILRRSKINEFPQLLNILRGEMTFVGPRPESPDLAERYSENEKMIFSVKPGLVSPATLLCRNEEEHYPIGVDPKEYYLSHILPKKIEIDMQYIQKSGVWSNLKYMVLGVKETIIGCISKKHIHDNWTQICLGVADGVLAVLIYLFSYSICGLGEGGLYGSIPYLPLVLLTRIACNLGYGLYSHLIRYISYHEVFDILKSATAGTVVLIMIEFMFKFGFYENWIAAIDWATTCIILPGYRGGMKFWREARKGSIKSDEKKRMLIYGACDEGIAAYKALSIEKNSLHEVVGFIDESTAKFGKVLHGKRVLGNRYHIKDLSKIYKIDDLLIAAPIRSTVIFNEIQNISRDANVNLLSFSPPAVPVSRPEVQTLRDFSVLDILAIENYSCSIPDVSEAVTGKTVLINSCGNAFGLELCRAFLRVGCARIIVLDKYEINLNQILHKLHNDFNSGNIIPCVMNSYTEGEIRILFERYHPDIVVQAGLRKFYPPYSLDLWDLGGINYRRTFNLAKTARDYGTDVFVMISSNEVYQCNRDLGKSLRVTETSLNYFFRDSKCGYIVARVCDIADNTGGIVSFIEDQIKNREKLIFPKGSIEIPLTSSHSASEFVLEAVKERSKKKAFQGQMVMEHKGTPLRLGDIAERIALKYGIKLGDDLQVIFHENSPLKDACHKNPSPFRQKEIWTSPPAGEEACSIFRDFVAGCGEKTGPEKWKQTTDTLMRWC
jgi:lipopolysaccharide/colanic/teichoic acid biosynthesis glycosyltransferase/FlaA1/EpsC-like NDP-sugar epimerase